MTKNSELYDAVAEAIDQTILHFMVQDPYYYIAPFFSAQEISKKCPFFVDNRITLPEFDISSDDLKTMSYLAPFYRNRIAYNPKNIDNYLKALGHLKHDESGMDIICYESIDCENPLTTYITYEEWLSLEGDYVITYDKTAIVQAGAIGESLAYAEQSN